MDLFWVVFVENGLLVNYVNEDIFCLIIKIKKHLMKVEDHLVKLWNGDKERDFEFYFQFPPAWLTTNYLQKC